jgi:FkbM family methyltransferase
MPLFVKKFIKKTPLYPILKAARECIRCLIIASSLPYKFIHNGKTTKFRTDDPYSYFWFYPRYSNGKQHEPLATLKFIEALTTSKVVADVGANLGWFTCIAASQNKNSTVYSFELDHTNLQICRRNTELNGLKNVVLNNVAVTNFDGELDYKKESSGQASPNHRLNGKGAGVSCKVEAIRLDTYFSDKESPEVVKIDVEGAEQLVLEGMSEMLHGTSLKTILIEIHPAWLKEMGGSVAEVYKLLSDAGFMISSVEHRSESNKEVIVDISDIESVHVGGRMFVAQKK